MSDFLDWLRATTQTKWQCVDPLWVTIARITPAVAREILEKTNHCNRRISPENVSNIKKSILEGFELTGEAISFGTDRMLKDGQHRLQACIDADRSFDSLLIYGLSPDVFSKIDIGRKRTRSDVFHIDKIPHPERLAPMMTYYNHFLKRGVVVPSGNTPMDHTEALAFIRSNKDIFEPSLAFFHRLGFGHLRHIGIPTLIMTLHAIFAQANRRLANMMLESMISMSIPQADRYEGIRLLCVQMREKMAHKNERGKRGISSNHREMSALYIKAWNAFVTNSKLTKLRFATTEIYPRVYGWKYAMVKIGPATYHVPQNVDLAIVQELSNATFAGSEFGSAS